MTRTKRLLSARETASPVGRRVIDESQEKNMYLGIGAMLSAWAHDNSVDITHKALFSSITTLLHGAMAAQHITATLKIGTIAQQEISQALGQTRGSTKSKVHTAA